MIEKCTQLILKLLPPGVAWNRTPSSNLYKLATALAEEICRVEARAMELLVESDPRTTVELLEDWERILGLPGECVDLASTIQERQANVVAKLISRTAQTKAYYVSLAATLGYTITVDDIIEYDAFHVGDSVGEEIFGEEWAHVFALLLPENTQRYFRVNENAVGDRLVEFGDDLLECVITDNKPAHTVVLFQYI
jgi:uncharacterized protein YmfQ (DUF2313 family)